MAKPEYFTFGENSLHCFEKKKCTLNISRLARRLTIQPDDYNIKPTIVSFDRHFYQLKNHLYVFDLVSGNDLVIVFPLEVICSKMISVLNRDRANLERNGHGLFKSRFLPPFCRCYLTPPERNIVDVNLINEIIQAFDTSEEEVFSVMILDHYLQNFERENNPDLQTQEVISSHVAGDSVDNNFAETSAPKASTRARKRKSNGDSLTKKRTSMLNPAPNLPVMDPSEYITAYSKFGNAKIIVFTSADKTMCYEYIKRSGKAHSYYCMGCFCLSKKNLPRIVVTKQSDGSLKVQTDDSKEHRCFPREFKESMVIKVPPKDDANRVVKPRLTDISVDEEDSEYVIREGNFKFETSKIKKLPNGTLIITTSNGLQFRYCYNSQSCLFQCIACLSTHNVSTSAFWCVDINEEQYIKLGKNKMNHVCINPKMN